MTPDQARRYVEVLDLYVGELEALVGETRADKPGLTSALNPHLHDMARGVAIVREKITADAENMTRMIAGMREEWGVHVTGYPTNIADWAEICDTPADSIEWFADEDAAEDFATEREDEGFDTRLVRRYVTPEEEA